MPWALAVFVIWRGCLCRRSTAARTGAWKTTMTWKCCCHDVWREQLVLHRCTANLLSRVISRRTATSFKSNIDASQVILMLGSKDTCITVIDYRGPFVGFQIFEWTLKQNKSIRSIRCARHLAYIIRAKFNFPIGFWARRWIYHRVCDAWPVRRQTYGYLPSHRASPPPLAGNKSYCLVNMCVNNLPRVVTWSGAAGTRTCDHVSKSTALTTVTYATIVREYV